MKLARYYLKSTAILLLILLISSVFIFSGCKKRLPSVSGSIYENAADFAEGYVDQDVEPNNDISKAYLSSINYEITKIDEEQMTADVTLAIPSIEETLMDTVNEVVANNPDMEYDELLALVKNEFASALNSDDAPRKTYDVKLELVDEGGELKLVPTEEWNELINSGVKEAYLKVFEMILEGLSDEIPE